ncbi:MAG TPA: PKD domain-containing protein, partial [Chitinophagales bacterium]|nr:PKD domain-containing protein [Chitinophagales bacterium]
MKTFRHLLLLLVLVGGTLTGKAQCGIDADFYQNLNPNQVPWFHDTSRVDNGWQITSYYWSFGDGSTSNLMNPTHVFPHPGAYNVCHYIVGTNNNGGTCIDSVCRLIQIGCNNMVYANISASVQGNIVVYTGTGSSNYPPLTFAWYFPGGQPTTSSTPVTTVQYTSPGSHQACLTVS